MRVYADSSFTASFYFSEPQSPIALQRMEKMQIDGDPLLLSELTFLEVTNAIQLGIFRKLLSVSKASQVSAAVHADMQAGISRIVPTSPLLWKTARELSQKHVGSSGCRSLDILHAAIALLLNAELFLTFDNRQRSLAVAAGLNAPDLLSPVHS